MMLRLDLNIWGLTIIGIYSPKEDNGATVKGEFFC